jgi:SAM-dependent methyltransferase
MARLELPAEHFDLIWSEGALYNLGLPTALPICHRLLKPGGYLVFTDPIWRKKNPPPHIKEAFEADYPTMGTLEDNLAAIRQGGFEVVSHFPLPDEAWWDDFYTPMEARIAALRITHAGDPEAQAILDQLAAEPENHRLFGDFYTYVFFVARRPTPQKPLMPNQV